MAERQPTHDLSDARAAWDRRGEIQFVDVREPYEWEAGRIEGATHIPLNALLSGAGEEELDPGRPVVAYCTVGQRSEVAKLMLQARGYDAYNMADGLRAWVAEGYPLTTPDGAPGRIA